MQELIEPGANQRIARFDLVVEEGERQAAVEGFDPEAQPAKLDGQRVEINAVDASFDDIPA